MDQLIVMGFARPKVELAMRKAGGRFDAALDILMADSLENSTIENTEALQRTIAQQNSYFPAPSTRRGTILNSMMQYPASATRSRRTRTSHTQQWRLERCVCPTCGRTIQFLPIEGESVVRCPFDETLVRIPRRALNPLHSTIPADQRNSSISSPREVEEHQISDEEPMLGQMMRVSGRHGSSVQIPFAVLMQAMNGARRSSNKQPASNEQIFKLPVRKLKSNDISRDQPKCLVCQEDFVVGEEVKTLPCFHIFHTSCIDQWLRTSKDCPVCKISLI